MQVFTVLGSHPALSNAEFSAVTGRPVFLTSDEVSVFDDVEVELTNLQARLGGAQKLGSIVASFTNYNHDELAELLTSFLVAEATDKKVTFGLSIYNLGNPSAVARIQSRRQALGLEVKKRLKGYGHGARYVTSKGVTLSAVDVTKNQILERGAEFCFLVTTREVLIGQTIAVQDYEDWSHRDYDRPGRDAKRGMLPPKLARMMVNMAGVDPKGSTLLDPFCGSGTVLMEAMMVGFDEVVGSDISEDAVRDTEENLDWLLRVSPLPEGGLRGEGAPTPRLFQTRASNIHALLEPESIDVVVTEPFLGAPRNGYETEDDILARIHDLTSLYRESFVSIARVMKPGATAVVAFPLNMVRGKSFRIDIDAVAHAAGLRVKSKPIPYHQKGQFVGREIVVMGKE